MKAITLSDDTSQNPMPWATLIEAGLKTIETRTWPVPKDYVLPIDVLICASASSRTKNKGLAVCVVTLIASHPMRTDHEKAAAIHKYDKAWAWETTNLRWLNKKFPVTGKHRFFEVEIPDDVKFMTPSVAQLTALQTELLSDPLVFGSLPS